MYRQRENQNRQQWGSLGVQQCISLHLHAHQRPQCSPPGPTTAVQPSSFRFILEATNKCEHCALSMLQVIVSFVVTAFREDTKPADKQD
jgi:hypothetical protein